jgi:nitrous oxidase accessory protein NosD
MRTTGRQLPFPLSPTTVVSRVAVVAIAAAGFFALTGGQALASHVGCGDTITADTKLDSDLVDCPGDGIVIGADGITLDLNGHTIDGDEPEDCGEICDFGVVNFDHAGVTIEGGSVREFALALLVVGAADNRLLDLSAIRSSFGGVVIAESPRTLFERNTVVANGLNTDQAGVGVFSSPDSRFAQNEISDNGDIGVFGLEADDIVFERNVLSGHPEAAFLIEGSRNVFSRNRVVRNAEGITVGGDENVITRNHVSDVPLSEEGGGLGIFAAGGHDNLVARNVVVRAAKVGIQVSLLAEELEGGPPAVNTVVRNNLLRGNRDGVFVLETAENTLIEDNLALASEDDGIDVDSPLTTLTGNHALHNGDLGIEAVFGVTDGGDNEAHGNGNPAQCANIVCR